MKNIVNIKKTRFRIPLSSPAGYQGGKEVIERLLTLFGSRNRHELGELLDVSPGTFATWQTRNTTPFELLVRVHIATGVPMEYLLFGDESEEPDLLKHATFEKKQVEKSEIRLNIEDDYSIELYSIENGDLNLVDGFSFDSSFLEQISIGEPENVKLIQVKNQLSFVNFNIKKAVSGYYLISINDVYQIAELRMLPDGIVYLFHDGEKYPMQELATVHGKVTANLRTE